MLDEGIEPPLTAYGAVYSPRMNPARPGDGNRTHIFCVEGSSSTIELHRETGCGGVEPLAVVLEATSGPAGLAHTLGKNPLIARCTNHLSHPGGGAVSM